MNTEVGTIPALLVSYVKGLRMVPDFLDRDTCKEVIGQIQSAEYRDEHSSEPEPKIGNRSPLRYEVDTKYLALDDIKKRIWNFVLLQYGGETDDIVPEFTIAAKMYPGDRHPLHADNVQLDGETPNHTAHRCHSAILYLNTRGHHFTGGSLVFPGLMKTVSPVAGLLVTFPSGFDYRHEVLPIVSRHRYTLAMWFTRDESRQEAWSRSG